MSTDGSVSTSAFLIKFKTVALLRCPEIIRNDSGGEMLKRMDSFMVLLIKRL